MRDVRVTETDLMGLVMYRVYVDEVKYDEMFLRTGPRLTYSQMRDMESYYREGLGE